MTKVGIFHVWVHVRHQKGRSWGGGGRAYIYIYIYIWEISYIQITLSIFVLDLWKQHMSLQLVFQHPTPMDLTFRSSNGSSFGTGVGRRPRRQKLPLPPTKKHEAPLKSNMDTSLEPKQWRWMVQYDFFFNLWVVVFSGELAVSESKETRIL